MDIFKWGSSESRTKSKDPRFKDAEAPVSQTLVWICEKCGSKLSRDQEENPARSLQKAMKHILSENKEKRNIRAMVSTCMNICPKEKIAASICDLKSGQMRFVEFEWKNEGRNPGDLDQLAQALYKEIR